MRNIFSIITIILGIAILIIFSPFVMTDTSYTIDGDKVYIDDANIYLSAEPHTIAKRGYVYFNFTSKVYTGDADFVFGFDTTKVVPERIELYKPTYYSTTMQYTCNGYFNYTTSPKHAWCYDIDGNSSNYVLIFDRAFDSGNLPTKTIYWSVEKYSEWQPISSMFSSINYSHGGMNKWFYAKDIPITQDKNYYVRVLVDVKTNGFNPVPINTKYWVAIKPSGETIAQAISSGHFYALDPWIDSAGSLQDAESLSTGIKNYWKFDEGTGQNVKDEIASNNLTIYGLANWTTNGAMHNAIVFNNTLKYLAKSNINLSGDVNGSASRTINVWGRDFATSGSTFHAFFDTGDFVAGKQLMLVWKYDESAWAISWGTYWNPSAGQSTDMNMHTVVYNGTAILYYLNGTYVNYVNVALSTATSPLFVGSSNDDGSSYYHAFHGIIDEIGIWNRSLTATEISKLYNNGAGIQWGYDTVAPLVTRNSPTSNISASSVSINLTLNKDGSGCWYNFNIGKNVTMQANGLRDYTHTNTSIRDGDYTAYFFCNDTAGNMNDTTTFGFYVDTLDPTISFGVGVENNGANFSRNWTYLNVTANDTHIRNITFRIWNSTFSNFSTYNAPQRNTNFTDLAAGTYYYNATVSDFVNRQAHTETRTITLDMIPPNATTGYTPSGGGYSAGVNNSFFNNATVNFTVNATSTITNIKNITVVVTNDSGTINITTQEYGSLLNTIFGIPIRLAEGIYYWYSRVTDVLGNTFVTIVNRLFIDTTYPVFAAQNTSMAWNQNDSYIYSFNVTITELYPNETGNEFNGVNYTAYNITATKYEINFTKVVSYVPYFVPFYWWMRDNATNYNYSQRYYFSLNCPDGWGVFNNTYCVEKIYHIANSTRYYPVPQNYHFTSMTINLTGNYTSECYQEHANMTSTCGGYKTGKYLFSAGTTTCTGEINDGDWTTQCGPDFLYWVNYTAVERITNITWEIKSDASTYNITVPTDCQDENPVALKIQAATGICGSNCIRLYCHNGSEYKQFYNSNSGNIIYEEAIIWETEGGNGTNVNYANNVSIDIAGASAYVYAGKLNHTETSSDIASKVNEYLHTCTYVDGYCNVPLLFHSISPGILRYSYVKYSNVGILTHNVLYNVTTYETKPESYILNMTYDDSYYSSILANFIYNGTSYLSTKSTEGNNILFTNLLNVPITDVPEKNVTFYWEIQLSNSSGTSYFNTSETIQQIRLLAFNICNDTIIGYPFVNYSFYNESTRSATISDIETTLDYNIGGDLFKNYSYNQTGKQNYTFCAFINETLHVKGTLKSVTTTSTKIFELYNETYTNVCTEKKLYINPGGTDVIIQVRDSSMLPLYGYYVQIYRYYPGTNEYILAHEAKTDLYGQFVANLVENTVKYKFVFKNEIGDIVKISDGVTIACKATICVLPFIIEDTTDDFESFKNNTDYSWSFSFNNNTNIFTYSWTDISGGGGINNLIVEQHLFNGTTTTCNLSSSASSSSLTCNVGSSEASYTAQAFRTSGGIRKRISMLSAKVGNITKTFGKEGLMISFFLMMTCLAFGYYKPTIGVILYGAAALLISFTNVIYVNPAILAAEGVLIAVFLWAFRG